MPALPEPSEPPLDLAAWTQALLALPPSGVRRPWILLRMRDAAARPDFQALAPRLRLEDGTQHALRQLARWAAQAYADGGNFTLLHAMTGTRAFVRLLPCTPADGHAEAVRAFAMQLGAAVIASGWTGERRPAVTPSDWDTIKREAVGREDEHAIKAVHAAWELARAWAGEEAEVVWRLAAARALDTSR